MSLLNPSPSPFLIRVLQSASLDRLQRGAEALSTYEVTLTRHDETEVSGFVANGDGLRYGVVLTEPRAFCSCPDAIYRREICKHAVVLALHVIRLPKEEVEEARPVNLQLGKVRPGWQACA